MFRDLLAKEFSPYRRLTGLQLDQLEAHYRLLCAWNKKINLTRIQSLEDAVRLHYCESLFLALQLPPGSLSMVDVGSGAGFPGLPIAIFRPDCRVTLVESHQRKAAFLREASRDLSNVTVFADRADALREQFDWLVARAVAVEVLLDLHLAPNLALLIGEAAAARLGQNWKSHSTPWGTNRVLAMFHVEHSRQKSST